MAVEFDIGKMGALVAEQLPKGIFLCVGGDAPNVMTIGWGSLAYYWQRPVFVAPLRPQRHTYGILEREKAFTVCVPFPGAMAREIAQAGILSGRDGDKFRAIGLTTRKGRMIDAPVIEGCALYLECRVLAKNAFDRKDTDPSIVNYTYSAGDFHTLYYGEIVGAYAGESA